jgi:hypothetical protein
MGLGKDYLLFLLMQTLLPQAPAIASTRFTGLPFFFPFIFTFLLFFFPFFFFLSIFYFFIFSPSFPLLFLVALLEDARKGIINNYLHFIL